MATAISYGIRDMVANVKTGETFAAGIDVPGIQNLEVNLEASSEQARGDGVVLATAITEVSCNGSFQVLTLDPVSRAALTGGEVVTTGTGETAVNYFIASAATRRPLIQIAGISDDASGSGQVPVIRVFQVRISAGGGAAFGDSFGEATFDFDAIALEDAYFQIELHADSDYTLPTTAVTTLPTEA